MLRRFQTADQVTATSTTPIIQQQTAGLVSRSQYPYQIWAKVASGTRKVSLAALVNAYATCLAGPTPITLTTSWQRFKIAGTLSAGQTGLWIVLRQFAGNGDDWTAGSIYLWGACLQQGNDPRKGYARTWAFQTANTEAGVASGAMVICAVNSTDSPVKVRGPGSNLTDHTLLEVTAGGELIRAGGKRLPLRRTCGRATSPSGWAGVLKVKRPAGTTLGYVLLYTTP